MRGRVYEDEEEDKVVLRQDIYHSVRGFVAGYKNRKADYISKVALLRNPLRAVDYDKQPCAADGLTEPERATDELLKLDEKTNSKIVHAVDFAKTNLIMRYGEDEADKTFEAFLLNAKEPRNYKFKALKKLFLLPYERSTFFRYKEEFYDTIADYLDLK